jgi:hypothetical protein
MNVTVHTKNKEEGKKTKKQFDEAYNYRVSTKVMSQSDYNFLIRFHIFSSMHNL